MSSTILPLWNTRGQELEWVYLSCWGRTYMGHRLNSFSPVDRNSIILIAETIKAGWWSRLGPAQIRDRRGSIMVMLGSLSPQCLEAGHWFPARNWGDAPSLLTSIEPFCACVVRKVSLTSRMRKIWSFISYLGKAQPPPSSSFYGVSAIIEFLSTGEKLFSLDPCISCFKLIVSDVNLPIGLFTRIHPG